MLQTAFFFEPGPLPELPGPAMTSCVAFHVSHLWLARASSWNFPNTSAPLRCTKAVRFPTWPWFSRSSLVRRDCFSKFDAGEFYAQFERSSDLESLRLETLPLAIRAIPLALSHMPPKKRPSGRHPKGSRTAAAGKAQPSGWVKHNKKIEQANEASRKEPSRCTFNLSCTAICHTQTARPSPRHRPTP